MDAGAQVRLVEPCHRGLEPPGVAVKNDPPLLAVLGFLAVFVLERALQFVVRHVTVDDAFGLQIFQRIFSVAGFGQCRVQGGGGLELVAVLLAELVGTRLQVGTLGAGEPLLVHGLGLHPRRQPDGLGHALERVQVGGLDLFQIEPLKKIFRRELLEPGIALEFRRHARHGLADKVRLVRGLGGRKSGLNLVLHHLLAYPFGGGVELRLCGAGLALGVAGRVLGFLDVHGAGLATPLEQEVRQRRIALELRQQGGRRDLDVGFRGLGRQVGILGVQCGRQLDRLDAFLFGDGIEIVHADVPGFRGAVLKLALQKLVKHFRRPALDFGRRVRHVLHERVRVNGVLDFRGVLAEHRRHFPGAPQQRGGEPQGQAGFQKIRPDIVERLGVLPGHPIRPGVAPDHGRPGQARVHHARRGPFDGRRERGADGFLGHHVADFLAEHAGEKLERGQCRLAELPGAVKHRGLADRVQRRFGQRQALLAAFLGPLGAYPGGHRSQASPARQKFRSNVGRELRHGLADLLDGQVHAVRVAGLPVAPGHAGLLGQVARILAVFALRLREPGNPVFHERSPQGSILARRQRLAAQQRGFHRRKRRAGQVADALGRFAYPGPRGVDHVLHPVRRPVGPHDGAGLVLHPRGDDALVVLGILLVLLAKLFRRLKRVEVVVRHGHVVRVREELRRFRVVLDHRRRVGLGDGRIPEQTRVVAHSLGGHAQARPGHLVTGRPVRVVPGADVQGRRQAFALLLLVVDPGGEALHFIGHRTPPPFRCTGASGSCRSRVAWLPGAPGQRVAGRSRGFPSRRPPWAGPSR